MTTHTFDGPSSALDVLVGADLMDIVSCTDGDFVVTSASRTGHISLTPLHDSEREKRGQVARAKIELAETDYQELPGWRTDKTPERLAEVDARRAELRRIVRGEAS